MNNTKISALQGLRCVFANSHGLIAKALSTPVLVGLGNVSMEIYLFHMLAIRSIPSIEYFVGRLPFGVELVLITAITALFVVLFHYRIEPKILQPLYRKMDGRYNK